MKDTFDRSVWISYFTEFTKRNQSRPTVLEVFGDNGAQTEERGLPFVGISLDKPLQQQANDSTSCSASSLHYEFAFSACSANDYERKNEIC